MSNLQKWTNKLATSWKNFRPPVRPSRAELDCFEKFLKIMIKSRGTNIKVLILGSTPELRNLVSSKNLTVYVCDYNRKNFEALKLLKKNEGKEILINQDWRRLKSNVKFDMIFAEASLNVVSKKDMELVFRSVRDHLNKGGLFVAKTWVQTKKQSVEKITETYRKKYQQLYFYDAMAADLYSHFYNKKNQSLSLKELYWKLKKLHDSGKITLKEFNSFSKLSYETTPLELYIPSIAEFKKMCSKYLQIIQIEYPKPIGTNKLPLFVMTTLKNR